jgi:5'-phosphate synthase pdxT subunit
LNETAPSPRIGVLAIQGDYEAHAIALQESGATPSLVRNKEALAGLDGLVMPGGESTTMLKFLLQNGFLESLRAFAHQKPVFGTCAGAILLAKEVRNPSQPSLAALDIAVERNAYGAQRDSAILMLDTELPGGPLETVFIRAPRIVSVNEQAVPKVEILAERDGFPVLVRQGNIFAATFHPEMSADRRVHELFVQTVKEAREQPAESPDNLEARGSK